MNDEYNKRTDETDFEYKVRLCNLKIEKKIKLSWNEIASLLNLKISKDLLRHQAYAYREYELNNNNNECIATTILSISDLHCPYQKDLNILSQYKDRIDILQLNGDILDCTQLSKFPKMFRSSAVEELIVARQWIINLIELINPKKVIVNYGNHDLRLGAYLSKNIDCDIKDLMPTTALDYIFIDGFIFYDKVAKSKNKYTPLIDVFKDIEIIYTDNWYSQIGDAIFCHPKTFSKSPLKTAENALYWFRNEGFDFKNLIMAHTHRIGSYKIGNSNIYEQGAMCETKKMRYSDGLLVNSQKEGYILLYQDKDGKTLERKTKIISLN